ncbi:MAG: LamG domain-containing protein [Lentisphaerae bacterium]|nr:LamG domain-containing protein [Lentisphaerota bacterium]
MSEKMRWFTGWIGLVVLAMICLALGCASEVEVSTRVWQSDGRTPAEYAAAAVSMLNRALPDDKSLLTLGTVTKILGKPSSVQLIGYRLNNYHAIDDSPQLEIVYHDKGVVIAFSTVGLAQILYAKQGTLLSKIAEWSGGSDIAIFGQSPRMTGEFTQQPDDVGSLQNDALEFADKCRMEAHWYRLMRSKTDFDPVELQQKCKSSIFMIDGIRDDLARVGFVIKGEHRLICHVWWAKSAKGWTRIVRRAGYLSLVQGSLVESTVNMESGDDEDMESSTSETNALFEGISAPPPFQAAVGVETKKSEQDTAIDEIIARERDADIAEAFKLAREVRNKFNGHARADELAIITQRLIKEKRLNIGMEDVVAKLGASDPDMRRFLIEELVQSEEVGLIHLRKAVRIAKPDIAKASADMLIELQDKDAGYSFAERLKQNPSDPLRTTLANGLRALKAKGAAIGLSEIVKANKNAELVNLALSILSDLDEADVNVIPALYRAVWNESELFEKRAIVGYLCSVFENVCLLEKERFNKLAQHDDAYKFLASYIVAGMKSENAKIAKWAYGYCDLFGLIINPADLIVHLRGNGKLQKNDQGMVIRWIDEWERSNDAVQTTLTESPILIAGMSGVKTSLRFDGENDYMKIPLVKGRSDEAVTVSCWIYFECDPDDETGSIPADQCIVSEQIEEVGGDVGFALVRKGDILVFTVYSWDGRHQSLQTTTKFVSGKWFHVGGTFGESQMGIFINGKCEGIRRCFQSRPAGKSSIIIGKGATMLGASPFKGRMANLSIYNKALKDKVFWVVAIANQPERARE